MDEEVKRIRRYINSVEEVLKEVKGKADRGICKEVVDLAENYLRDAKYYLYEKGDKFTSLACIAYGEGLLDCLRHLGLIDFKWPKTERKRVLVGGVFDIIHPGHIYLLKRAKNMGEVIVVLARDSTVIKMKGRRPIMPEEARLNILSSIKYVDKVILGKEDFKVKEVLRDVKPNIVLLGPDQGNLEDLVKEAVRELKLNIKIIRIKETLNCEVCKTSKIINRILNSFKSLRGEQMS